MKIMRLLMLALSGMCDLPDTLYGLLWTFKGQKVYQGLVGDLYRFLSHADFFTSKLRFFLVFLVFVDFFTMFL